MSKPAFEFFDVICGEVRGGRQFVLTERSIERSLAADLRRTFRQNIFEDAVQAAVEWLSRHFAEKGSSLPFRYSRDTGIIEPLDVDFIRFVADAVDVRSVGRQSKDFETAICGRLSQKLRVGDFHNVGWPRRTCKRLAEIVGYLEQLGFDDGVLRGRDKDGGLDILWLPPLGTIPIRPIVSVQCKNARFTEGSIREANNSAVIVSRSIHRHSCMKSHGVYMSFVVFNDYLDSSIRDMAAGLEYAPLGLSDLAPLTHPMSVSQL